MTQNFIPLIISEFFSYFYQGLYSTLRIDWVTEAVCLQEGSIAD